MDVLPALKFSQSQSTLACAFQVCLFPWLFVKYSFSKCHWEKFWHLFCLILFSVPISNHTPDPVKSPCTVIFENNPFFYFHPYCLCLGTASHILSPGSLLPLPLISASLIQHSRQPWVPSCLNTTLIMLLPYLKPTNQPDNQTTKLKAPSLVPKSFSTSKSQLLILPVKVFHNLVPVFFSNFVLCFSPKEPFHSSHMVHLTSRYSYCLYDLQCNSFTYSYLMFFPSIKAQLDSHLLHPPFFRPGRMLGIQY